MSKNTKPNGTTPSLLSSSSASSLCRLPVVALASCLLLAWTGEGCMIQGTDSGFCDYRYHPMYYSKTPSDPYAWLSEPKGDWQSYVAESAKMWANGTEPGQFGSCQTASDGHCLSYCGKYVSSPPTAPSAPRRRLPTCTTPYFSLYNARSFSASSLRSRIRSRPHTTTTCPAFHATRVSQRTCLLGVLPLRRTY